MCWRFVDSLVTKSSMCIYTRGTPSSSSRFPKARRSLEPLLLVGEAVCDATTQTVRLGPCSAWVLLRAVPRELDALDGDCRPRGTSQPRGISTGADPLGCFCHQCCI